MAIELRTPFCRLLGIEHPVLNAGIGRGAGPELAAAVSNAGGFGVLGASGVEPDDLRKAVARTRTMTDRPLGINLIIDEGPLGRSGRGASFILDQIRAAAEEDVAVVVLFWGDPSHYVEQAHRAGMKVLIQVGSVEEAEAAAAAGVDAVIAQGVEAGGHVLGTTSIWELLPDTVEAISPLPVLASGGIGDGAGLARALAVGAQGVSLGTRFVASDEAYAHQVYKERVVASSAEDTVYTADLYDVWWPDAPHRTLRNRTFAEWEEAGSPPPGARPGEGTAIGRRRGASGELLEWPRYATGMLTPDFEGDLEYAPMWAGESCGVVNDIKPAAEIVRDLVSDADAALASLG